MATRAVPTRAFPAIDVLSVVTGRSMGDIRGVYKVLGWMTGESLFDHQLQRVSSEAAPVILAFRPDLAAVVEEVKQVNGENWRDWLATWTARYGETIEVPRFTADEHERIDPFSELAEKLPLDRIVIIGKVNE